MYQKKKAPRFPTSLLFPISEQSKNVYSLGITQLMYTPKDISTETIIPNDYPYAGALYIKQALTSYDEENKQRLTTEMYAGVLGPYSYAKESQIFLHRLINYTIPQGWHRQIPTDIIIGYNMRYEKLVASLNHTAEIIARLETNAGTLFNNASVGFTIRTGKINSFASTASAGFFEGKAGEKRKSWYLFFHPSGKVVLGNSMLQGGFFSEDKAIKKEIPIASKDRLERIVWEYEYGITVLLNRWGFSFKQKMGSPLLKDTPSQEYGSLVVTVGL
jgi:hypothetical protein